MVKKGRRSHEDKDKFKQNRHKIKGNELTTGRSILTDDMKGVSEDGAVNFKVHTFYYGWYGNPEMDGAYSAWNHQVIPHWIDSTWND